jgi:HEPN domain-containing protein
MKKLTAEWVRKAEADIEIAKIAIHDKPALNDPVCFHCQQAIEKYLKGFLQELGQAFPYTHDLDTLLDLLLPYDATLKKLRRGLSLVTQYAVDYRYPGVTATSRQAKSALRLAERARLEIRARLKIHPRRSRKRKPP